MTIEQEARAEAEMRLDENAWMFRGRDAESGWFLNGFIKGAEWAASRPVTDADVEKAARAAAKADASDCFDRIDEWEGLEQWQRDASPNEYPDYDHEDAVFWRSIAKAALVAAFLTVQPNPTGELVDKAREGIRERDFSDQITILNAFLAKE